jgi:hypothetical protein
MRARLLFASVFLLAWPLAAAAQAPLLPAQLAGWKQTEWQRVEAPDLERIDPRWAAFLREYGCQRAEQATYLSGKSEFELWVYAMQDRSSAYGAFTLRRIVLDPRMGILRPVAMGEAGVAEVGVGGAGQGLFYQGQYFVRWRSASPPNELIEHLKDIGGPQPSLPTLPGYLPKEGFVENSDRYLLGPLALAEVAPLAPGDWAGFAYGAEAEAGRYRVGPSEATLLLLSYPTPQIASQRLRDFERLFNLNGVGDPARPLAFAKRSGTLVILVSGVTSGQDAATLLNRVRYETEISWSETSPAQAEPHWTVTMLNLFIGTGLFVVYAFLSALAFAGVRLLIQRLLPGKVFNRPEDTEIICLDLSFKR